MYQHSSSMSISRTYALPAGQLSVEYRGLYIGKNIRQCHLGEKIWKGEEKKGGNVKEKGRKGKEKGRKGKENEKRGRKRVK